MQNEEIMIRPPQKKKKKMKRLLNEGNQVIVFQRVGPWEALQHNATWQSKWVSIEKSEDHPPFYPMQSNFPSQASTEPVLFPANCKYH